MKFVFIGNLFCASDELIIFYFYGNKKLGSEFRDTERQTGPHI